MRFQDEGIRSWLTSKYAGPFIDVVVWFARITRKGAWLPTTKPSTASWPYWMNGNGACSQVSWPCVAAMAASLRWLRLLG
jgi:hypothetical protein